METEQKKEVQEKKKGGGGGIHKYEGKVRDKRERQKIRFLPGPTLSLKRFIL